MDERRHTLRRELDRQRANQTPDRRGVLSDDDDAARKKRRAIRHNCEVAFDTEIARALKGSDEFAVVPTRVTGRVLDLSGDGMLFYSPQAVTLNDTLHLRLKLGDDRVLKLESEIRWIKSMKKRNGYGIGVKFHNLDEGDEATILTFLDELDETLGM